MDELCTKEELASLRYPEGGTPSPKDLPTTLNVHPEFKVSLVASEPLINKVMNIDWDGAGRLWVVETPEYPDGREVNPGEDYVQRWQKDDKLTDDGKKYNRPAYDRISILTDTDGDGVMDKKHIFADHAHGVPGGLELVTSFVLHRDGVIACSAPDIWFLRDTNGDGTCDKVEKLYTGLGTRDTHSLINNLRWGFDGWIYGTHGYSSSPDVTSGDGAETFRRHRLGRGALQARRLGVRAIFLQGWQHLGPPDFLGQRSLLDAAHERRPADAHRDEREPAHARGCARPHQLPRREQEPRYFLAHSLRPVALRAD